MVIVLGAVNILDSSRPRKYPSGPDPRGPDAKPRRLLGVHVGTRRPLRRTPGSREQGRGAGGGRRCSSSWGSHRCKRSARGSTRSSRPGMRRCSANAAVAPPQSVAHGLARGGIEQAMCIKLGMLAVLTCFCTGHKSLQLPYKTYGKHHHTKHMGLGYFFMPWALPGLGGVSERHMIGHTYIKNCSKNSVCIHILICRF